MRTKSTKKMADAMGVSWTAMNRQLTDFGLIDYRPLEEYIEEELRIGRCEYEIFF